MRTLIIFLALTTTALATPCDDDRKDFERAQKFGATNFQCVDRYDGSARATWEMTPEQFKEYIDSELERQRQRIKKGGRK